MLNQDCDYTLSWYKNLHNNYIRQENQAQGSWMKYQVLDPLEVF